MTTDLADEVTRTADALQKANDELAASRTAVTDAESAILSYEGRARAGLSTSPSTYGDRRAALDLAHMALASAEVRVEAADEAHRFAVAAHVADVIVTDDRLNGSRESEVSERVSALVQQAHAVAVEHYTDRNAALAEVHGSAVAAGLPTADTGDDGGVRLSNPLAPVAVRGSGLYVAGQTVAAVKVAKAAKTLVQNAVDSLAVNQ